MLDLDKIKSERYFFTDLNNRFNDLFSMICNIIPSLSNKQKMIIISALSLCLVSNLALLNTNLVVEEKYLAGIMNYDHIEVEDNFVNTLALTKGKELARLDAVYAAEAAAAEQARLEEERARTSNIYYDEIANAGLSDGPFRLSLYNHNAETMINNINASFAGYPLAGTGEAFVQIGTAYNVDPYVLAAMATEESARGLAMPASYNAFGITNGGVANGFRAFNSFEEAISYTARTLSGPIYLGRGMTSLYEIGPVYCPSPGGWADRIINIINSIAN